MLGAPRLLSAIGDILVPIAELRDFLRVDGADLDTEIASFLAASAGEIERRTGFRLGRQTIEVVGDTWADFAHLLVGPVRAIAEVQYQDRAGDWHPLKSTDVELFGGELEQGVRAAAGRTLPRLRSAAAVVKMRLDVGSEAIETPLRWALLVMCRAKMDGVEADVDHLLYSFTINP